MPWLARRNMVLNGKPFKPGEEVPQRVIDKISPGRVDSMRRVGVLLEGSPAQIAAITKPKPELAEGEAMCDICGDGPFKALSQHQTKMHPDESEPETEES